MGVGAVSGVLVCGVGGAVGELAGWLELCGRGVEGIFASNTDVERSCARADREKLRTRIANR
jgi:hypothetical protein